MGTILRLSDHPAVRARDRARLRRLASRVLTLLESGEERAIYRLLTPLSARELAEVRALLMVMA